MVEPKSATDFTMFSLPGGWTLTPSLGLYSQSAASFYETDRVVDLVAMTDVEAALATGAELSWARSTIARLGERAGSIAAFVWAYLLGPGDALAFTLVCALSGLAYGAELALPASLLADIAGDTDRTRARQGAYFGTWQLVEKLNLALAAGISLPLLQWSGYEPGTPQGPMGDLSVMYAVVPCALKAVAVWMLWRTPFETTAVPPHPTGGKPS